MENNTFIDKKYSLISERVANPSLKFALLIIPVVYLTYNFFHALGCHQGILGCGINDLGVIFPFYVLLTAFVGKVSIFSYFLLHLFSSVVYLVIFYHFAGWLEELYFRYKFPAKFTLKRV